MDTRIQAQLAASWYLTQLDQFIPNHENVQKFLRAPLVALTAKAFLGGEEARSSDPTQFLRTEDFDGVQWQGESCEGGNRLQRKYDELSRRTKIRMEAMLASCALAAPTDASPGSSSTIQSEQSDLVSLQEGLSGFFEFPLNGGPMPVSSEDRPAPSIMMKNVVSRPKSVYKHPQIQEDDLVMRLDIYIRTVQRVKNLGKDCVIATEPPRLLKARACIATNAFVATTGTVRNLRLVLTRLLNCLTMETLAVEVLSEDTTKVIKRIVSEYEHATSFASLAFLSTPEVSAGTLLTPLIVRYMKYLQAHWEELVRNCELERMLKRALDSKLRSTFKTAEFRSIGHLLELCSEYQTRLQNIELSPNACTLADDIHSLIHSKEALRQALRDLQREVITVNGHVLPPVRSRKGLLNLLMQTLNAKTFTAAEKQKLGYKKEKVAAGKISRKSNEIKNDDSDYLFSSEADSGVSDMSDAKDDSVNSQEKTSSGARARVRRRNFHVSTIDLLTRRLLIAASRTGNGGDAYFIVRDLFGGEDVEVVPVAVPPLQGRKVHPGTIDILVRLASVTIKCHQSFNVYPKSLVVEECEPLVQFHATTTETIALQEVQSTVVPSQGPSNGVVGSEINVSNSMLMLQERSTANSGWRTVSIRPAAYERVAVWGTPS